MSSQALTSSHPEPCHPCMIDRGALLLGVLLLLGAETLKTGKRRSIKRPVCWHKSLSRGLANWAKISGVPRGWAG